MEQLSGSSKKNERRGVPLWLLFVLIGVIFLMSIAVSFMVLLHLDVIRCVPVDKPVAEATPTPDAQAPTMQPTQAPELPTPDPVVTAEPTEVPTAEPTEEPTEAPTAEPTAKPTPLPDWFWFGGQKIKTGSTSINGK